MFVVSDVTLLHRNSVVKISDFLLFFHLWTFLAPPRLLRCLSVLKRSMSYSDAVPMWPCCFYFLPFLFSNWGVNEELALSQLVEAHLISKSGKELRWSIPISNPVHKTWLMPPVYKKQNSVLPVSSYPACWMHWRRSHLPAWFTRAKILD